MQFFYIQNRKMNLTKTFLYHNFVAFFAFLGNTSPLKLFSLSSTKTSITPDFLKLESETADIYLLIFKVYVRL